MIIIVIIIKKIPAKTAVVDIRIVGISGNSKLISTGFLFLC
jgi:hypothetical protein